MEFIKSSNEEIALQGLAIGVGQSWRDVTASRASNTTYTNTTGKPIFVIISTLATWAGARSLTVDGVVADEFTINTTWNGTGKLVAIIPPNSTCSINGSFTRWTELR
jgi:hypothetical protein